MKIQDIFTRSNEFLPDMPGGQTEFREDCKRKQNWVLTHQEKMILRVPWCHFLRLSDIIISRNNPNISEEISDSFRDKLHW